MKMNSKEALKEIKNSFIKYEEGVKDEIVYPIGSEEYNYSMENWTIVFEEYMSEFEIVEKDLNLYDAAKQTILAINHYLNKLDNSQTKNDLKNIIVDFVCKLGKE